MEILRMLTRQIAFALMILGVLGLETAQAQLTIDNFEEGDFYTFDTSEIRPPHLFQSNLDPANNIATRREVSVNVSSNSPSGADPEDFASLELATDPALDDAVILYVAPETNAFSSIKIWRYDLETGIYYFDISGYGESFNIELTEAPTYGTMSLSVEFAGADPGLHYQFNLNGPGKYSVNFDQLLPATLQPLNQTQVSTVQLFLDVTTQASETRVSVASITVGDEVVDPCPELEPQLVEIDIVPGDETNPINLNSKKSKPIELAVFGSDLFDVNSLIIESVVFADSSSVFNGNHLPGLYSNAEYADLNGDGLQDLLLTWDREILLLAGAFDASTTDLTFFGEIDECGNIAYGTGQINIKSKGRGKGNGKGNK